MKQLSFIWLRVPFSDTYVVLFQLCALQGDDLAPLLRHPTDEHEQGEEVPETEDEELDKNPETYIPRTMKHP